MPTPAKFFRWMRWTTLAVLGVIVVTAVWLYVNWNRPPDYWQVVDAAQPSIARDAERFELWTTAQITRDRLGQPQWRIEIDQQQVNQWLASRLTIWAFNQNIQLPDWLHEPMVVLSDGQLIAAARIQHEDFDNIVSFVYEPRAAVTTGGESDDVVTLDLSHMRIGSLTLPADMVLDQALEAYTPEEQLAINDAIRHVRLTADLDDGRTVDVIQIQLNDGKATLTCRTLGPK